MYQKTMLKITERRLSTRFHATEWHPCRFRFEKRVRRLLHILRPSLRSIQRIMRDELDMIIDWRTVWMEVQSNRHPNPTCTFDSIISAAKVAIA